MTVNDLIGKQVFSVTGPGDFATCELASDVGKIIATGMNEWLGPVVIIEWEEAGRSETAIRCLMREWQGDKGIGVYIAE